MPGKSACRKRAPKRSILICSLLLAACGGGSPDSNDVATEESPSTDAVRLAGAYLPRFPPGTMRFEVSLTDRRWEFSPDGAVTTFSSGGPRPWTYEVDGRRILLAGSGASTQGERRVFTIADDDCIWDGTGNRSADVLFCPEE
jgi:hypothetical protein